MVAELALEKPSAETRSPEQLWALTRAGLFAAPESGLDATNANAWLEALRRALGKEWTDAMEGLRAQQQQRARIALGGLERTKHAEEAIDELLGEIQNSLDGYRWYEEVQERPDELAAHLVNMLRHIAVRVGPNVPGMSSLHEYLQFGREKEITRHASAELQRRWIERMSRLQNSMGLGARIAATLWSEAAHLNEVPTLDSLKRKIDIAAFIDEYRKLKAPSNGPDPWDSDDRASTFAVGSRLRVRRVSFAWRDEIWSDRPLAKPLFELVWDVLLDEHNGVATLDLNLAWWNGVGVKWREEDDEARLIPWPFIDWPTFYDHHLFADAWNKVLGTVVSAAELVPDDETPADDLAYWYLSAIDEVVARREVSLKSKFSSGSKPHDLSNLVVQRMTILSASSLGLRGHAYKAFLSTIPLLAAPESGLSPAAAEAILKAARIGDVRRQELHKLRRDRMRHRKPPKAPIQSTLKAIDAENPGHPWVELIEKPSK